jgi:hypothetical protein
MTDNKWRNRKVKAFRVSEALEEKIKYECERRRTDFSSFMRYATVVVLPQNQLAHPLATPRKFFTIAFDSGRLQA